MARASSPHAALAAQAWALMFDYLVRSAPDRTGSLAAGG